MSLLGILGLTAACVLLGIGLVCGWVSRSKTERRFQAAKIFYCAAGCLIFWCTALLAAGLWFNDFSLQYVIDHSSLATAWYYRLSALWAGQEGATLLWVFLTTVSTAAVTLGAQRADFKVQRRMVLISSAIVLSLLVFMLGAKNPFAAAQTVMADGRGLNPLLEHWAMIVHPPLLFMGYAFLAVVFVLACSGGREGAIAELTVRWSRWACAALTAGIGVGALWAYAELGWGGYWGWDPVENASLLPWFASFAMIHFLPRTARRFGRWTVLLAGIGFGSCILAAYLTRSGIVFSVHAFADGTVHWVWLAGMAMIAAMTFHRARQAETVYSRHSGMTLLTGMIFLLMAMGVLAGTLWPIWGRIFTASPATPGPDFYNSVIGMLGLGLLGTMGWCGVRHIGSNQRIEASISALTIGSVGCFAIWFLFDVVEIFRLAAVFLIFFNMVIGVTDMLWFRSRFFDRLPRNLAHLGVAVLSAGLIASIDPPTAGPITLGRGSGRIVDRMQVSLEDLRLEENVNDRYDVIADLAVRTPRRTVRLEPKHWIWEDGKHRVLIDYRMGLAYDIYATMYDFDEYHAVVSVQRKWLVSWVWAGSAMILISLVLAGMKRERKKS